MHRRYSGRGDPALTDLGWRQADAAARYLAQRGGISAVVTSPLQRCHDTATVAAKALGLDVGVDDDLIETDFGGWEGLTFAEAAERDRNCIAAGSATPAPHHPAGKASTRCTSECCGRATGSSPGTPARRCWWCRT
ncbi:histidine phosphatase super family protein [Mycobacterium xenopi 4042]|uniref:Histidine phosphatase super family protein n=1 Tax=Mycobacterium xenopi 4042 TaxID=1299334 RepID=X8DD25_MYCXE|nr:histidine phosphatase super family protein [Mycobacterium xenopi 4042]